MVGVSLIIFSRSSRMMMSAYSADVFIIELFRLKRFTILSDFFQFDDLPPIGKILKPKAYLYDLLQFYAFGFNNQKELAALYCATKIKSSIASLTCTTFGKKLYRLAETVTV